MKLTRKQYGFTLVELLVALSLITLILSAAYGSWRATSQSALTIRKINHVNEIGQRLGEQMARQLRCSYYQPTTPGRSTDTRKPDPLFKGFANSHSGLLLDFVTTETLSFGEEARFGLVRTQYRFDRSSGSLYHREIPYINNRTDNEWPQWHLLADRVASVELIYLDGEEELAEWDSVKKQGLPHEVRLTVSLQDSNLYTRTFNYVIHPVCMFTRGSDA